MSGTHIKATHFVLYSITEYHMWKIVYIYAIGVNFAKRIFMHTEACNFIKETLAQMFPCAFRQNF